jgi:hypothetical protein
MKLAGHVAHMGEGRGVYRVLVGRPKGKGPLGRPRHRWEGNTKMDLRETGIDRVNWIHLAGFCEPLDSTKKAGYFLTS